MRGAAWPRLVRWLWSLTDSLHHFVVVIVERRPALAKPGRSHTPALHPSPAPPQPPPLSSPILRPRPCPHLSECHLCTNWRRLRCPLARRTPYFICSRRAMQNRRSDCVTVFGLYAPREDQLDIAEGVQIKRLDLLALNGAESAAKRIHPKNSRPARAPSSGSKNLHGALAQCTYLTVHFLLRRRGLGRTRTLPSFSSTTARRSCCFKSLASKTSFLCTPRGRGTHFLPPLHRDWASQKRPRRRRRVEEVRRTDRALAHALPRALRYSPAGKRGTGQAV